ncbi:4-(cytidine 5'-diphospho)-2-C-methyl-D-erythritol kinase [Natronohydrobacter thiooxidans]|uniref:4-(cytidine 5'-diphospho)-2-C-methyl-D-erythritol kinase n=1 Tax=Natronohydrobacter thiooxidans TaxID=87172 RepID=UPI0008FF56DF|nr:4-(cytidine 5'-diphospho)-2-C-methyl-D-erythritol kinase [Natronohydrobacter thiooxidans]
MSAVEAAPAKINLCLHVTGQREDGYHLLDSLVAFAEVGDKLSARPWQGLSLSITGPEGAGLSAGADNLVLRAARLMGARDLALTLDKRLPLASGIGGGSSDAAACLRLLAQQMNTPLPSRKLVLGLGADVPVCLEPRSCRMRGIGEAITCLPPLPPLWLVLVNPRVEVPTPQVFRALARRDNPPLPDELPIWPDAEAFCDWLAGQRNDLEAPAISLAPVIGQVLDVLGAAEGCALARMSGSGATCFGIFTRRDAAERAAATISAARPNWWCVPTGLVQ